MGPHLAEELQQAVRFKPGRKTSATNVLGLQHLYNVTWRRRTLARQGVIEETTSVESVQDPGAT